MGAYYATVNPTDLDRALAEYEQGVRLAPDNVSLLGALAATEPSLGRWDSAAARLARAALLDPRSASVASQSGRIVRTLLRQYPAADSAADRALALAPTNLNVAVGGRCWSTLGQGHLDSARAVIRAAAQRDRSRERSCSYLATYQDLYWVLDDAQQRQVLALPPSAFDDDRANWGIVLAQLYHLRGDRGRTAALRRLGADRVRGAEPGDAR